MKKFMSVAVVLTAILVVAACGGGSSSGGGGSGLNSATVVSGTVRADNGDPLAGTTIFIPTTPLNDLAKKAMRTRIEKVAAGDGTTCNDPSVASCASACSGADGSFTMDTTACVVLSSSQLVLEKGALQKLVDLNCPGTTTCELTASEGTFGSGGVTTYPKVAVVTGSYDQMQNVLAKIAPAAYGTIDASTYELVAGTENTTNLTFINGNESSDYSAYDNFDVYLDGTKSLTGFDIVFINCGDYYDYKLETAAVKTILSNYVNNGGKLYVTDLSYDFINQVFPEFMNFYGNTDSTTPGSIGAADYGRSGLTVDAAVNDATMKSWLGNVTVNQHDASTPGNPSNDCTGEYTTRTGALTAAGTIPIGDFMSSWALMDGAWSPTTTSIWISSGVGVSFNDLDNRPLTASRKIGTGYVFYSSYHTAHGCATPNFWPQERVLQYLILEAF